MSFLFLYLSFYGYSPWNAKRGALCYNVNGAALHCSHGKRQGIAKYYLTSPDKVFSNQLKDSI